MEMNFIKVKEVKMDLKPQYLVVDYYSATNEVKAYMAFDENDLNPLITENTRLIINLI